MQAFRRWVERNEEDKGITTLWSTPFGPPAAQYEVALYTTPLNWGIGASIDREIGANQDGQFYGWPHRLSVSVEFGPWEISLTRTWGNHQ